MDVICEAELETWERYNDPFADFDDAEVNDYVLVNLRIQEQQERTAEAPALDLELALTRWTSLLSHKWSREWFNTWCVSFRINSASLITQAPSTRSKHPPTWFSRWIVKCPWAFARHFTVIAKNNVRLPASHGSTYCDYFFLSSCSRCWAQLGRGEGARDSGICAG